VSSRGPSEQDLKVQAQSAAKPIGNQGVRWCKNPKTNVCRMFRKWFKYRGVN
jgi:hypothetical protein